MELNKYAFAIETYLIPLQLKCLFCGSGRTVHNQEV